MLIEFHDHLVQFLNSTLPCKINILSNIVYVRLNFVVLSKHIDIRLKSLGKLLIQVQEINLIFGDFLDGFYLWIEEFKAQLDGTGGVPAVVNDHV